jgi:hypothetical protein
MLIHRKQQTFTPMPAKLSPSEGERGSVAWVDLWNGILICDLLLLDSSQSLRYIPLPSPRVPTLRKGPPLHVRDINLLGGYLRYFEMGLHRGGRFHFLARTTQSGRRAAGSKFAMTQHLLDCPLICRKAVYSQNQC